jgi:hypothetical protein
LPDGLSIDAATGLISGTVADDAVSPGAYPVTVEVEDGNGQSASQDFDWIVNDSQLTAQVAPISAEEGTTFQTTVATFTDSDLNRVAGNYSALIAWGDGSSDLGEVSGANGQFTVSDSHVYLHPGTYPIQVQISDDSGGSVSASAQAIVSAAPLQATGVSGAAVAGTPVTETVATFTDGNTLDAAESYTATIYWGDGTNSNGVVEGGAGAFNVSGTHAYATPGNYAISVTIADADQTTATASSAMTVGNAYAGQAANLTVASFTSSNPNAAAGDFTATINWGDGTAPTSGVVTGSGGQFAVGGSHSYAAAGLYSVQVTLTDQYGDTLQANGTVNVVHPALLEYGSNAEVAVGTPLSNDLVSVFVDPDVADTAATFAGTQIVWGDGTTSAAQVTQVGALFAVRGSDADATAGTFAASVQPKIAGTPVAADLAKAINQVFPQTNPFNRPVVDILSSAEYPTNTLRIAQWQNAFADNVFDPKNSDKTATVKPNLVDLDPRRYYIKVIDPGAANKGTITVTVQTTQTALPDYLNNPADYVNPPTQITLTETGPGTGIFVSKALLLVSNKTDNEYKIDGVANNAPNDRSEIVALGGSVLVTYKYGNGLERTAIASVPVAGKVNLYLNVLNDKVGGTPIFPKATVLADVAAAQEVWAQAGIEVTYQLHSPPPPPKMAYSFDPPAGVDLTDGVQMTTVDSGKPPPPPPVALTAEERALLGNGDLRKGAEPNSVYVYFVNTLWFTQIIPPAQKGDDPIVVKRYPGGTAFTAADTTPNFANSVLIGSTVSSIGLPPSQFVLAHELGHVLFNDRGSDPASHNQDLTNLMFVYSAEPLPVAVTNPERLTPAQVEKALASPLVVPPGSK